MAKRPKINIGPQPGPQTAFLQSTADIGIYGGSAGGGKSFALLLEPIYHLSIAGFGAVAFRRTTPQLRGEGGLWDTSCQIYPYLGGVPHEADLEWIFPPHRVKIKMSHIEHERNRFDWDSTQIPLILFDQLEGFSAPVFWHMVGRNRSTCGVRPYIRASCNPISSGWLHDLVCSYWVGEDGFPVWERSGKLRWMVRLGDDIEWGNSREEVTARVHEQYGIPLAQILPLSVTFVPGLLTDNKILMEKDPTYLAKLHALPRVERERLLGGNWNVIAGAGDYFQRQWCEYIDAPPDNAKERIRSWDLAGTRPSAANPDPDWTVGALLSKVGKITVIEHVVAKRDTPGQIKDLIARTAEHDRDTWGRMVKIRLARDPGQAGVAQIEDLIKTLDGYTVMKPKPETGSKETRAGPFSSAAEHGLVKIVKGPWVGQLLDNLEMFPRGRHDDYMDSVAGGYNAISGKELPPPTAPGSLTRANPYAEAG